MAGEQSPAPSERELTREERNAIATLERLAKRWPKTLALWGGLGNLIVVRTHDGALADENNRMHYVTEIKISAGGGDPDWAGEYGR